MRRALRAIGTAAAVSVFLAGCAESVWAPEEEVQRALYSNGDPPSITLYTVQSTRDGNGAHSGLLVNGAHRAFFDPAGSFKHPGAPERNDVLYGITENVKKVYIDYHARETFDVVEQTVVVPPEVANQALAVMQAYGPVPNAQCALAVSRVLSQLDGFENIPVGWFPNRLSEAFAQLPGATYARITDTDADKNHGVLFEAAKNYNPEIARDR